MSSDKLTRRTQKQFDTHGVLFVYFLSYKLTSVPYIIAEIQKVEGWVPHNGNNGVTIASILNKLGIEMHKAWCK